MCQPQVGLGWKWTKIVHHYHLQQEWIIIYQESWDSDRGNKGLIPKIGYQRNSLKGNEANPTKRRMWKETYQCIREALGHFKEPRPKNLPKNPHKGINKCYKLMLKA